MVSTRKERKRQGKSETGRGKDWEGKGRTCRGNILLKRGGRLREKDPKTGTLGRFLKRGFVLKWHEHTRIDFRALDLVATGDVSRTSLGKSLFEQGDVRSKVIRDGRVGLENERTKITGSPWRLSVR